MKHIICFGNLLQGDDGFGQAVLARLRLRALPDDVRLFDAGLSGPGALSFFEACEEVVVVDALSLRGNEGRVHQFGLEDVHAPRDAFSAHELDVNHLFHVLPIVFEGRRAPRITIVGAEIRPGDGTFRVGLSPALAAAVDEAVQRVHDLVTPAS